MHVVKNVVAKAQASIKSPPLHNDIFFSGVPRKKFSRMSLLDYACLSNIVEYLDAESFVRLSFVSKSVRSFFTEDQYEYAMQNSFKKRYFSLKQNKNVIRIWSKEFRRSLKLSRDVENEKRNRILCKTNYAKAESFCLNVPFSVLIFVACMMELQCVFARHFFVRWLTNKSIFENERKIIRFQIFQNLQEVKNHFDGREFSLIKVNFFYDCNLCLSNFYQFYFDNGCGAADVDSHFEDRKWVILKFAELIEHDDIMTRLRFLDIIYGIECMQTCAAKIQMRYSDCFVLSSDIPKYPDCFFTTSFGRCLSFGASICIDDRDVDWSSIREFFQTHNQEYLKYFDNALISCQNNLA